MVLERGLRAGGKVFADFRWRSLFGEIGHQKKAKKDNKGN